jgi:acetyl-CoA C-acetyltransferase
MVVGERALNAYIVSAVRTPVGRRRGSLASWHPADLSAVALRAAVDAAGVPPDSVEDVIWGCVSQIGAQSTNVGRTAALSAGLPESVPGTTVDRQCGSSQQAIQFAAQAVLSGTQDVVVAGGVEIMSSVPLISAITAGVEAGYGDPFAGLRFRERYGDAEISQFYAAEAIAEKWGFSREVMEAYAVESHRRALAAIETGVFADEIVPVDAFSVDEGPRADTSLEKLASLAPLREGGRITAAMASQISDGSAALVIASERSVGEYGLTPLARIVSSVVVGSDPIMNLTGPIPATAKVLERAGLGVGEIDTFEVNEAFVPVVLAWLAETGAEAERVNPSGGAVALGHPLGASGAKLATTLVHRLRREGQKHGLLTMCEGGGMANATIIERV